MTQVAVRLPESLVREVDDVAGRLHSSRSDVIRRALEQYLYRLACERDAAVYEMKPLSDAELALADATDGWSQTPQW
jgi:predicted transcriptional regulator